jgi:hypothetical protein
MVTTKDQFVQSRLGEYSQITGAIDKLQRRARIVGNDVSREHHEQMEGLLAMRDDAMRKIEAMRQAPANDWQSLADDVDNALAELEAATRRVVADLRR